MLACLSRSQTGLATKNKSRRRLKAKNYGRVSPSACKNKRKAGDLPLLDVAGGDKEVAGRVLCIGGTCRGNLACSDRRDRNAQFEQ